MKLRQKRMTKRSGMNLSMMQSGKRMKINQPRIRIRVRICVKMWAFPFLAAHSDVRLHRLHFVRGFRSGPLFIARTFSQDRWGLITTNPGHGQENISFFPILTLNINTLLAFEGICLVIIGKWPPLSHILSWFWWIQFLSDGSIDWPHVNWRNYP